MEWKTVEAGANYRLNTLSGGSGSPLVYLHGFAGHPGEAAFLESLAQNHTVFAPDIVGYGKSEGFEHIDDILDMTLALRQFVEAVADEPVDLIGHSLGGMLAGELAAVAPQVVRKLVLVAPFGLWLDEHPVPDLFVMNKDQLAENAWHNAENAVDPPGTAATNGHDAVTATLQRTANLSVAGKFLWPIPDRGLRKRLPLVKAPTLVLTGESDKLIPAVYGQAFADLIPNAKAETISAAGHYPMLEQEQAFTQACKQFLGAGS